MLTTQFLISRQSTRDFKDEKLDENISKILTKLVNEESEKQGSQDLLFQLYTDGEDIYNSLKGVAGYRGVMIKAPGYIALNTLNTNPKTIVKGAYGMEDLITKLHQLGLGSCRIDLDDVDSSIKEEAFNLEYGDIDLLLAVGYPLGDNTREHKFDERKATKDIVFIENLDTPATDDDLLQRGLDYIFDYAKFAPSAYNSQPWRFLIKGDMMKLYIEDYKGDVNLIDSGIIMYYIDELSKSVSSGSKWDINPELSTDKYTYIAEKKL